MSLKDIVWNMIPIPGRLTSAAVEKVVCGADEVYDDSLDKRQSELNAQFKAITDQMVIAINGGTVEIANTPESVTPGSGAIPTANAIAQLLNGLASVYMRGTSSVVSIDGSLTVSEVDVEEGTQKSFIYQNDSDLEVTVNILNTHFRTPDGENISIAIPAGGYGEASFLNISGTVYARGC